MAKTFYYPAAAIALLIMGFIVLKPASDITNNTTNMNATSSAQGAPVINNEDKFTVTIKDGKNATGPQTYTSTEGRAVRLVVTSNTAGKFDVHGYTKDKKDLVAGLALELSFTADKTGRFDLEFHPEQGAEVVIGALVVNPK